MYNSTASTFNGFIHIFSHHCRRYSDFVQMFHLVFHDGNQRSYHNNRKWHSILPSFQRTLYLRKQLENKTFSKASEIAETPILPTTCFKQFLCSPRLASTFEKSTQRCVCCEFEFCVTGRRVCHHRHIPFLAVIEDAPLLTKTVKIHQSEGIPGSGIPERTFVKNSYKRSHHLSPDRKSVV